ncbi:MAG: zinc ribbon domain-containing protein [Chloroflexi bacterium]|nr:zinc ribbon domain-containing protein [Chloroflexota bacterium]
MPIYEYECPGCSCRFEQKRSFSDTSPAVCPHCHRHARRVFSPVPIIFKGSGFYVTDHKGEHGRSASADSETPAPAKAKTASADSAKDAD